LPTAPHRAVPGSTTRPSAFLPIRTVKYGGEKVIDFSNPLTIKLERERATQAMTGHEKETGRVEMDFADWWDKCRGSSTRT